MALLKFITPYRYSLPDKKAFESYERRPELAKFEKRMGARFAFLKGKAPNDGLIRGEYETGDNQDAKAIIEAGTCVRCVNPQDAVDQGWLSAEFLRTWGYDVIDPPETVFVIEPKKEEPLVEPGIDFDTMTKPELLKYALGKGIQLDGRQRKDYMLKEMNSELKKLQKRKDKK